MTYTDSPIGYATGTVTAPSPTSYSDSPIGYKTGTITAPAPPAPYSDSPIGYATKSLGPQPGAYVWDGTKFARHTPHLWASGAWQPADVTS